MPLSFQKSLIVNADDFGLHTSINHAIELAHRSGVVTSASLMAGSKLTPAYRNALEVIRNNPRLDIGLHFALVGAPGLPDDYVSFLRAKAAGNFPSSRIITLLRRQIDTVLSDGVRISHLDSHQHLHALPSIMRCVASVGGEYGIRAVRLPQEWRMPARAPLCRRIQSRLLALLCIVSKRELASASIRCPDHFAGMSISGSLNSADLACAITRQSPGTTEFVCHPGSSNIELEKAFPWGYDWEGELAAVTGQNVIDALESNNTVLTSFANLH